MSDIGTKLKKIKTIHEAIYGECEKRLFYSPNDYQRFFQKIMNSSSNLSYNAMHLLKNQKTLPNFYEKNLSVENIQSLLIAIYNIVSNDDYPNVMEQKIRKLISGYKLNIDDLLITIPSDEKEYIKTKITL